MGQSRRTSVTRYWQHCAISIAQKGRIDQPPRGIVRIHPFLTGVGLWALVHLIGNGDVASLVFFATWAIVALAGTVSIDEKLAFRSGRACH
jgi:uncharacterized membrane protein